MLLGLTFVIVFGVLIWVGNNTEKLNEKIRDWQSQKYEQALQKYIDEMRARYAADTDGGKTLEETIDLFINALKAGDIEKASKYYVLEKQEEELNFLRKISMENGNVQQSLEFYVDLMKNGIKKCNDQMDRFTISYYYVSTEDRVLGVKGRSEKILVPAGEKSLRSESFSFNSYANIWKIGE